MKDKEEKTMKLNRKIFALALALVLALTTAAAAAETLQIGIPEKNV